MEIQKVQKPSGVNTLPAEELQRKQNRQVVATLAGMVTALFEEVATLPISESAKTAMVTVMTGEILQRKGTTFLFIVPPGLELP